MINHQLVSYYQVQQNLTFRDVNDNMLLDGTDLKEGGATATFDQQNQPIVTLTLKDANKFAEITGEIAVTVHQVKTY